MLIGSAGAIVGSLLMFLQGGFYLHEAWHTIMAGGGAAERQRPHRRRGQRSPRMVDAGAARLDPVDLTALRMIELGGEKKAKEEDIAH